ncbi:MAG: PD-(D/E)XK nuclease family protein [Actinomycetota bacterium]
MSSIKVSYSESDAARQCKLKWHLAYVERWRTTDTPAALARGTALHAVQETHYAALQLRNPTETPDKDFLATLRGHMVEHGLLEVEGGDESVDWMYDGYTEFYGCDNAWEILAIEVDFDIPLYDHTGAESQFRLQGRIDLIVRNRGTGKIFVVDHKTCSNLPTAKALDFDEQMALYTIAGRRMGFDVYGAIYNAIRSKKLVRKMTPEERFSRAIVTKTEFELTVVEHELVETMLDAHRPRQMDPPRSPDPDRCNWKCPFKEACLAGRKMGPVRMREFLRDTGFKQPDGYPDAIAAAERTATPAVGDQMDLIAELEKLDPRSGDTVRVVSGLSEASPATVSGSEARDAYDRPLSLISRLMRGS